VQRSRHRGGRRIHTSRHVAVLPEAEDIDVKLEDKDLRIESSVRAGQADRASTRPTARCASPICDGIE